MVNDTEGAVFVSVIFERLTGWAGTDTGGGGEGEASGAGAAGRGSDTGEGTGGAGSSTLIPKSVASPARPESYPWPTARNFHAPLRRYSSPSTNAVSVVASVASNRAVSAPLTASSTRTNSPGTWPNVPSVDAATTTVPMSCSTAERATSIVSTAPPPSWRLPSWRTAPLG